MSRHWLLSGAKLLDSVEATFLRQAITCTGGVVGAVRIKELLPVRAFGNTPNFISLLPAVAIVEHVQVYLVYSYASQDVL